MNGDKIVSVGKGVFENTCNNEIKNVFHVYSENCPECGASRFESVNNLNWNILRPIKVISDDLHLVKYKCKCGKVFKKVEVNK